MTIFETPRHERDNEDTRDTCRKQMRRLGVWIDPFTTTPALGNEVLDRLPACLIRNEKGEVELRK